MEGRGSRFRTYLEPTLLLPMPISMGVFVFETVVLHTSICHTLASSETVVNSLAFIRSNCFLWANSIIKMPKKSVRFLDRFVSHVAALAGSGLSTTVHHRWGNLPSGQKCR